MSHEHPLELLYWIQLECAYCHAKQNMRDYHWQYHVGNNQFLPICPTCNKENVAIIKIELRVSE